MASFSSLSCKFCTPSCVSVGISPSLRRSSSCPSNSRSSFACFCASRCMCCARCACLSFCSRSSDSFCSTTSVPVCATASTGPSTIGGGRNVSLLCTVRVGCCETCVEGMLGGSGGSVSRGSTAGAVICAFPFVVL